MSVVVNTNLDSLKVQSVLTGSTNKLSQSMQRMSSGLKINSAKDDAAGTVISARMDVQLDGNKICQNNVQNANALLSTAEGNLDVVLDNVSRIRDLTLQAKNGTYSDSEIQAMQEEVEERIAEIDRVSESSKFSQLQLFGGDMATSGISFQVGANSDANNTISIGSDKNVFKSVKFVDLCTNDLKAEDIKSKVANFQSIETSDALAQETKTVGNVYYDSGAGTFKICTEGADGEKQWETYTGSIGFATTKPDTATKGDLYKSTTAGVTKYEIYDGSAWKELENYKGQDITSGKVYADNSAFNLKNMTSTELTAAIDTLDTAINNITSRKSAIGSAQNRLESALDTLTTQYTNLSSAKSIITDADIASEASTFTQNQILQQVSTSLLAQANQSPSIALSLL